MGKTYFLRINDNYNSNIINSIRSIFIEYKHLQWKLLFLEGVYRKRFFDIENMPAFENEINTSKDGLFISLEFILDFFDNLNGLIDLTIIGDENIEVLKKHSIISDVYLQCFLTIAPIDSSYWEITCKERKIIETLKEEFPNSDFRIITQNKE